MELIQVTVRLFIDHYEREAVLQLIVQVDLKQSAKWNFNDEVSG